MSTKENELHFCPKVILGMALLPWAPEGKCCHTSSGNDLGRPQQAQNCELF